MNLTCLEVEFFKEHSISTRKTGKICSTSELYGFNPIQSDSNNFVNFFFPCGKSRLAPDSIWFSSTRSLPILTVLHAPFPPPSLPVSLPRSAALAPSHAHTLTPNFFSRIPICCLCRPYGAAMEQLWSCTVTESAIILTQQSVMKHQSAIPSFYCAS